MVIAVVAFGSEAGAVAGDEVNLRVTSDAWYEMGPGSCSSPIGCPPLSLPSSSTYPEHTLHVETTIGQETARSYLALDLSQVPPDATLTSGQLVLPLSADDAAGTQAPEAAELLACLATEPFSDDADGSRDQAPAADCSVRAAATFSEMTFTIDLGPLLDAWKTGKPQLGVALVPAPDGAPASTWHLAFDSHDRTGADVRPITATLSFARSAATVQDAFRPTEPSEGQLSPLPSLEAPSAPVVPGTSRVASHPRTDVATRPIAFPATRFRYPAVMLMPVALLIGGLFLAHTFTQPATPKNMTPSARVALARRRGRL